MEFEQPQDLKVADGLLSLTRSRTTQSQIGSDAGTLLWMNDKYVLRIDSPRVASAEYPDQGSSTEIYTNSDAAPYVELETFGPLSTLKVGDRIERTNRYALSRRAVKDPDVEARKALSK